MPKLLNVQIPPAIEGVVALQRERLPVLTGVKLRKLAKELRDAHQIIDDERKARLRMHAIVEDDEMKTDEKGSALFASPDAEKAFREEYAELLEGETEISGTINVADLKRRERDENGKVYETDDIPAVIVEQLGDLLVA